MPRIIVSGLTAAGKTTHSQLISAALSIPYFSGSELLSKLVGLPGPWTPNVDAARSEGEMDRELDRLMLSQLETNDDGIFDAWTLPWLSNESAIRVWIGSDLESRVRKATVTELRHGRSPEQHAMRRLVVDKDTFSRDLFGRLYGFDLMRDHGVFDLIIDNSSYILQATIEESDRGIQEFDSVLMDRLAAYL